MFCTPPLGAILDNILAPGDDDLRSMGWNLLHDHRIDTVRFAGFANYVAASRMNIVCPATMKKAVLLYHQLRIQRRRDPDFVDEDLNESNFHGRKHALPALYGKRLLVRVLDLTGLGELYLAAKGVGVTGFDDYLEPMPASGASGARSGGISSTLDVVTWLDRKLARFKNDPAVRFDPARLTADSFLAALLEFMNRYRRSTAFQPVWATGWTEFSSGEWQQPERWQQMLGVRADGNQPVRPSWLLLLRYPAREAGQIVRPTQLDSGWYSAHFPTPPSAPTGHAMDLDHARRDRHPLPEYIHQQMDHTPAHLVACARMDAASPVPPPPPQRRHYRNLERLYPDVPAWTQRPHPSSASPPPAAVP